MEEVEQLRSELREAREALKKNTKKLEGEAALLSQKLQLAALEIEQLRKKSQEDRNSYQVMLQALEEGDSSVKDEEHARAVADLKRQHCKEKAELEAELTKYKASNGGVLEQLRLQKEALAQEKATLRAELDRTGEKLGQIESRAQELAGALDRHGKEAEASKDEALRSQKSYFQKRYQSLHRQFQEFKEQHNSLNDLMGQKNQEEILKLKRHCQSEREQCEALLQEEREKKEKQLKELARYYEGRIKEQLESREEELVQLKVEFTRNRQCLKDSMANAEQQAQARYQRLDQEYLACKIQLNKQNALLAQENEFLKKQLADSAEQREAAASRAEARLAKVKEEAQLELKERTKLLNEEKSSLEDKVGRLNQQLKDLSGEWAQRLALKDKQAAVLVQKLQFSESKRVESERKAQEEMAGMQQAMRAGEEALRAQLQSMRKELEQSKQLCTKLEESKTVMQSQHETEVKVLQESIAFVRKQKERADSDLSDFINKFQMAIGKVNELKDKALQKQKVEFTETLTILKEKHNNELRFVGEKAEMRTAALEEQVVRLTAELRQQGKDSLSESGFLQRGGPVSGFSLYANPRRERFGDISNLSNRYE